MKYTKRQDQVITAVQVNLDMNSFMYEKWGGPQVCKQGDWIVNNNGEVYTVDKDSFAASYTQISIGVYIKTGSVWAEVATENGTVATKEGLSEYNKGDYLVCNNEDGTDCYCVSKAKFESMYERQLS